MNFLFAIFCVSVHLLEKQHQYWSLRQIWFDPIGSYKFQVCYPLLSHPFSIINFLFFFNNCSDVFFHFAIRNNNICPRLSMCSTWRSTRGSNYIFDNVTRNFPSAVKAYGSSLIHKLKEFHRSIDRLSLNDKMIYSV